MSGMFLPSPPFLLGAFRRAFLFPDLFPLSWYSIEWLKVGAYTNLQPFLLCCDLVFFALFLCDFAGFDFGLEELEDIDGSLIVEATFGVV